MLVALSDVGGALMDVVPNYTHSLEAWDCGNPCPLVWNALLQKASGTVLFFFKGHSRDVRLRMYVCASLLTLSVRGYLGSWGRCYMVYKEDCVLNVTTTQGLENSS